MQALYEGKKISKGSKLFLLALAAAAVWLLGQIPVLAEYLFARGITRWFSALLSAITGFFPLSFYEWTAVALIAGGFALLVGLIVLLCRRSFARARRWLYRLAAAALCAALAFGLLYAPLYRRASAADTLGLPAAEVNEQTVYDAAAYFVGRLNETSALLERDGDGNVVPPYTFDELARLLNEQFDRLEGECFSPCYVRPKSVVLSAGMSYLGITGIYFPFYAEANVNRNIPAYQLACTMAHEMAHAKGVSREADANIAAYVVCVLADDAYLNYSGLMPAAARLLNALPAEQYEELYARLAPAVRQEYANANAHYARYEGVIGTVSGFFNDLFLKANGISSGTRNYSETTGSLVALYALLNG